MKKDNLLVIVGPTAVGKTDLSIEIAERFNGEIISGDSMQIYQGMDIGTAKIRKDEMRDIPHYLIDTYKPDHYFSAAEFQEVASKMIVDIESRGKLPIIVGGTGLYIKSVTHNYKFPTVTVNKEYRDSLQEIAEKYNNEYLHMKLRSVDPEAADKLHPNDQKRIIRALEIYHSTGKTSSQLIQKDESSYNLLMIGLTMDRQKLYSRINRRVDKMIEEGLVNEVKNLLKQGYNLSNISMQGIGYKEIILYLQEEISFIEAVDKIKQGSRRYAKRQLSWFRAMDEIEWFDVTNDDLIEQEKIKEKIFTCIAGKFEFLQNK